MWEGMTLSFVYRLLGGKDRGGTRDLTGWGRWQPSLAGIHVGLTPGPTPPWEESPAGESGSCSHQASHSHEGATNKDTVGLVGMNVAGQERAELSALDISPVLWAWYLHTEMNQKPRMTHRFNTPHMSSS